MSQSSVANTIDLLNDMKVEVEDAGERWVPIFPELRPHLEAVFDAAPEGSTHLITRYRGADTNLRTQLLRILRRAGVKRGPGSSRI